jgi:hypothetical protein
VVVRAKHCLRLRRQKNCLRHCTTWGGSALPDPPWSRRAADILYPLQYIPPACSPLCPMRLVCAVTVYSTLAKCNRPKWSGRSSARAAVRAARAVRSGPLLVVYGTIPYHFR